VDQWRGALGLEAEHSRGSAGLDEALPVGRDVAGVADRDAERIQAPVEVVEQLERGGLLPLQAKLVDGVDERDRVVLGERPDELERLVEVAAQGDHAGAVHQRLGELAGGDLAVGHDHGAAYPRFGCVGRGARRGVAGRGADHRRSPLAERGGDRTGHAAVLE